MKKPMYLFLISFMMTSCAIYGFFGMCITYENMSKTALGESRTAIGFSDGKLRILDFEFRIIDRQESE